MTGDPRVDSSVNFTGQVASGNTFGDNASVTTTIVIYQVGGLARAGQRIPGNPYVGMRSFSETESARFFGREKLVEQLWDRFAAVSRRTCRFLAILGASGSGKSSVARAGLMAELDRRPLPDRAQRLAIFTPGARPLEALAGLMARVVTNDPAPTEKQAEFLRVLNTPGEGGVHDGLRRIAGSADRAREPLAIVIDQFDEIFSVCESPTERKIFIDSLLDAASEKGGGISLIVTMRSDYLGEAQTHGGLNAVLADAEQHYMLPAMSTDGLRRAIVQPAKTSEPPHPIDDEAVVSQLISETVRRDGALPLLQYTLQQIWDGQAGSGRSPEQTLLDLDGVGGALGSKAELIYLGLDETQKAIAKRAFVSMVKFSADLAPTRQRVVVDRLVADDVKVDDALERQAMFDVIKRFAAQDARLVTLGLDENGDEAIEVTHEALFEHWPTLKGWLEDGKDDIRLHVRVAEAAELWKKSGGPLWVRPDLDRLRILATKPVAQGFSPVEREFFNASVAAHRRRRLTGLAAAAAVLALTAFSAWEWRAAEDAIGLATDATNNMSVNLVRRLIGVEGGASIRRELGEIVKSVEERLNPDGDDNGEFSRFWTLVIDAKDFEEKSKPAAAASRLRAARDLAREMSEKRPHNLEWKRNHAISLMEDAGAFPPSSDRLRDLEKANRINQENVVEAKRSRHYKSSAWTYRHDLIISSELLALYHGANSPAKNLAESKALPYYKAALKDALILRSERPTDDNFALELSDLYSNYALYENNYDNSLAEPHYKQSINIIQALREKDPTSLILRIKLARVLNSLTSMYLANKDLAQPGGACLDAERAKTATTKALATSELALNLPAKDGDTLEWAEASAQSLYRRGLIELGEKRLPQARERLDEALRKVAGLADATNDARYRFTQSLILDGLAQVELAGRQPPAARLAQQKAIGIVRGLLGDPETRDDAAANLPKMLKRLSDIERSDGHWPQAAAAIQEAIDLTERRGGVDEARLERLKTTKQEIAQRIGFQPLNGCHLEVVL